MRIALALATSVLVAGCSAVPAGKPGPTELTPITPSGTASSASKSAPSTTSRAPASSSKSASISAPGPSDSAQAAIAWVEAGPPADGADFQVALRGGASTPLGEDTAFTTPSGISCMTDTKRNAGLACLVDLVNPPPQPADVYGVWKGGWVDFDGSTVRVGSAHGDPGRFALGSGAPLPQGNSLSFGDFRCRADVTTLVCVNYARKTAVRYSDDGVTAYGCTRQNPPPAGVGEQYTC